MAENPSQPIQWRWSFWVRLTHWLVVFFFFSNHFLFEPESLLHEIAGLSIAGLVVTRLIWGILPSFITPKREQLIHNIPTKQAVKDHLFELKKRHIHHQGHNPLGMIAIWLMWVLLLLTACTGYFQDTDFGFRFFFEEWHELFANLALAVVIVHISAVLVMSLWFKDNLIKKMLFKFRKNKTQ